MKVDKREITFWNTARPLTSKRVSIILGNPIDSDALANAIRSSRKGGSGSFKVSQETLKTIAFYKRK